MVRSVYNLPDIQQDDASAARHWLAALPAAYSADDRRRLADACDLLVRCRGNQTLETGESQVRHILSTADILVQLNMDVEALVAATLNGCLRRSGTSEEGLRERFGAGIANMVADLAHIEQIANVDAAIAAKDLAEHEENLRRLLLGIAEDVRVVLVVLAQRLHLMRSIKNLEDRRRRKIAQDTQRVYAPLANRLGVWQIKWELEDLILRYLEPKEYKRIAKLLDGRRGEREAYIAGVMTILREKFAEAGVKAEISGRPKHIYSIWRKMQRKNVDIEQIFDLRAVRIMVDDVASCYAALGIVNGLWKHIPKEFDDYIATPKGNMYQSLHTAVVGPEDKPLEVQIRTWDMHRQAELGVAAHWAYKESKQHDDEFQRRVVWMRKWLELKTDGEADRGDLFARFRAEFEPLHIYVLTPQSKVIELPKGATPLDFAYAIHSEIGNRCRGARVDGRIAPLNQPLHSGQTVEILTQKNAAPSRDWLSPHQGYLRTAKARNRVRRWFKQQDHARYVSEGKTILDKELARLRIDEKPQLDHLARRHNFHKGEDLLAAIGRGEVASGQVARQVGEPKGERRAEQGEIGPRPVTPARSKGKGRSEVTVEGIGDLMTHMAHCCRPVPNDPIIGYVTRGRGVTVHRRDCSNVRKMPALERQRLVEVRWAERPADATYPADIFVVAADRKGLLRDVSAVFSDEDVDVFGVHTVSDRAAERAMMRFTVEVKDMAQLEQVVNKLTQVPDVLNVRRPH